MSETDFEFSRRIRFDQLAPSGTTLDLEADPSERAALAERFGLLALDGLTARVTVIPLAGGALAEAEGVMRAQVIQACVVSLDPVEAVLEVPFHRLFGPSEASERDVQILPEDADPPDPLIGGAIELGEAVAEELGLALDPFPRKPGAEFRSAEEGEPRGNPFASLAKLKEKPKKA